MQENVMILLQNTQNRVVQTIDTLRAVYAMRRDVFAMRGEFLAMHRGLIDSPREVFDTR